MQTLATVMARGLRWAFPTVPPECGDSTAERVARAMDQYLWRHWEPRNVAGELGLLWSVVDEEQWRGEYRRCPGCDCWVAVLQGGDFCQGCLAC